MPTTPYTEGVEAFAAWLRSTPPDASLLPNPHPHGTPAFAQWRDGWQSAQRTWEEINEQEHAGHFRDRR